MKLLRAGFALVLWGLLLGACSLGTDIDVLRERVTGDGSFTVTFNSNGGSSVVTQTVNSGGTATRPANPVRTGYVFDNWYSDAGLTTMYNFSAPVTGDITLYAKWNPVTYTVAYDKNAVDATGTMTNSSHTYDVEKALNINGFTRNGYAFFGWARTVGGTVEFTNGESVKNLTAVAGATVTLYAVWLDSSTVWTVRFETNGGSPVGDAVVLRNTPVSRPALDPSRTGYTFDNWFADEKLTTLYNFSSIVIRDTTLYAKWNPITYTIVYDKNTADATGTMTNSSHAYDVDKNLNSNAFTRIGYTFDGWARTADGAVEFTDGESVKNLSAVAGAMVTLHAKWMPNTAGIILDVEQIIDGAPIIAAITISRANSSYPATYTVSVNAADYDAGSINWEIAGIGAYAGQTVTGSGASFTLNAGEVKYNSLGDHALILTVTKGGQQYQRAIPFTIVR